MSILVVDDDDEAIEYVTILLEEYGYEVQSSSDGVRALSLLRLNENVELIVSDMQMPPGEWGGLWLVEQLKDRKSVPIIILSERGTISKAVDALKSGATDYVEKGKVDQELIPAIEKALFEVSLQSKQHNSSVASFFSPLQNALGNVWLSLTKDTKTYLANSESIYHKHYNDENFDFSVGIIELAKAIEHECNIKIINLLRNYSENAQLQFPITINLVNGSSVPLYSVKSNLTLGQLTYVFRNPAARDLCTRIKVKPQTLNQISNFLYELRNKHRRNDAAHSQVVDLRTFEVLRASILGINCESPLKLICEFTGKELV